MPSYPTSVGGIHAYQKQPRNVAEDLSDFILQERPEYNLMTAIS